MKNNNIIIAILFFPIFLSCLSNTEGEKFAKGQECYKNNCISCHTKYVGINDSYSLIDMNLLNADTLYNKLNNISKDKEHKFIFEFEISKGCSVDKLYEYIHNYNKPRF